jgi:hypothetical protein
MFRHYVSTVCYYVTRVRYRINTHHELNKDIVEDHVNSVQTKDSFNLLTLLFFFDHVVLAIRTAAKSFSYIVALVDDVDDL